MEIICRLRNFRVRIIYMYVESASKIRQGGSWCLVFVLVLSRGTSAPPISPVLAISAVTLIHLAVISFRCWPHKINTWLRVASNNTIFLFAARHLSTTTIGAFCIPRYVTLTVPWRSSSGGPAERIVYISNDPVHTPTSHTKSSRTNW